MSVRSAHGVSIDEISKYDSVFSLKFFSIAENKIGTVSENIKAFIHAHDEYEFIIPFTTIPLLYYEKANYIGEVGFCYPVNPYVEHGLEFDLSSHVVDITVDKEYLDNIKKEMGFEGQYFYTRFLYKKNLIELIRLYQEKYVQNTPDKIVVLTQIANQIITLLIKNGLSSGEDNRRPEKQYTKNMKTILVYMFDNFRDKELTIAKLAKLSGYSLAYFTKAFKSYMHDTPIMHLNKLRISEAKMLFAHEELLLINIADMVGYRNLSSFTEAFKRVMNMTPSIYRKKYYS